MIATQKFLQGGYGNHPPPPDPPTLKFLYSDEVYYCTLANADPPRGLAEAYCQNRVLHLLHLLSVKRMHFLLDAIPKVLDTVYMVNRYKRIHKSLAKNAPVVSTTDQGERIAKLDVLGAVKNWPGEFQGDSRLVLCELIAAFCNNTRIEDSSFNTVRTRARLASAVFPASDPILDVLYIESRFYFPRGITQKQALEELRREHDTFCAAVNWLCQDKQVRPAIPQDELERLAIADQLQKGRYPCVDQVSESFIKYLEEHGLKDFQSGLYLENGKLLRYPQPAHVVDLFCHFLVTECLDKSPNEMPIRVCRGCGKLFSAITPTGKVNTKKEHCSRACQQAVWWPKQKRADDAYVKRLREFAQNSVQQKNGYSRSDLFERLRRPDVKRRLADIKKQWKTSWPKIVERVKEIEEISLKARIAIKEEQEVEHGSDK